MSHAHKTFCDPNKTFCYPYYYANELPVLLTMSSVFVVELVEFINQFTVMKFQLIAVEYTG